MVDFPETPELDRQRAVLAAAQELGNFLDWLRDEQHINLMKWDAEHWQERCVRADPIDGRSIESRICLEGRDVTVARDSHWQIRRVVTDHGSCGRCGGIGHIQRSHECWVRDGRSFNQLLADYFSIDLDKIEAERRSLLEAIRAKQS